MQNVVKHKLETINEITEVSAVRTARSFLIKWIRPGGGIKRSWEIGIQMPIPVVACIKKASNRFQSESNKYEQPDT